MRSQKIFLFFLLLFMMLADVTAAPSPWDSWRAGYTNFEQGEALRERGRYSEALEKFEKARQSYLAVRSARPDWNQRVIADRLHDCERQLNDVRRLLGGNQPDAAARNPGPPPAEKSAAPSASDADGKSAAATVSANELFKAKAELMRLRQELAKQRDLEAEISALLLDKRVANEKLALLEKKYQALKNAQNSPSETVADLERRIVQEKMESGRARRRYEAAEGQLQELSAKLKEAQLKAHAAEKKLRRTAEELKRKDSELLQNQEQIVKIIENIKNTGNKQLPADSADLKLDNLVNLLRNTGEQLKRREKQLALVQDELHKEQSSGRVAAVELANLREYNRRLENDVKLYSEQLKEVKARLERRNSEDFRSAAAASETKSKLEKELLSLQQELISVRSKFDGKQNEIVSAGRKIKSLEAELISVRTALMQKEQQLKHAAVSGNELHRMKKEFDKLRRDFKALSAENRENRLLAEAAKPQAAELENVKLRLLEMDRLKNELAREQQISAELKKVYRKDQSELKSLRAKAGEFESSRRRLIELEAAAGEITRLREVEKDLERIRGREAELAELKIRAAELESSLRRANAAVADSAKTVNALEKNVTDLKKENAGLLKLQRINEELKALVANQSAELDKLKSGNSGFRNESGSDREFAAEIGSLHDRLQKQQSEQARREELFAARIAKLSKEISSRTQMLELKEKELADVKKINAELADYRKNSVDSLRDKVDLSRISRLEDELASLSRLNAELAAERDKLLSEAERKTMTAETVTVTPAVSPEQSASSGVIAETDGNFELAIWNYRQALEANPDFAPAHLRLGTILFARGSYQEAVPHLSAALAADPANIALAKMVVRCQIKLKRYGNARSVIEPLLKRESNDAVIQMCAALIDAGTGKYSQAEERLHSAVRLAPESAEIRIELARLLANSITDRRSEAALMYEAARRLGSPPDPQLEKVLGSLLDHRREVMRFMSSAAGEAELNRDWNAAVWYYKKLIAEKHNDFAPRLALAQWKSGNVSGAKETLEFHKPSREGMLVRAFIALDEKDESSAMDAIRQAAGVKLDPAWVGGNSEISNLKSKIFKSAAAKALLQSVRE